MSKLSPRLFARHCLTLCAALLLACAASVGQERRRPTLEGGVRQQERRTPPVRGGVQQREEIPDLVGMIEGDCQAAREALDLYHRAAPNTELVLSDDWEGVDDRVYAGMASCVNCPIAKLKIYIELLRRAQFARADPRARAETYKQLFNLMTGKDPGRGAVSLQVYDQAVQRWRQKIQATLQEAEECYQTACTETLRVIRDASPPGRPPRGPVRGGVERPGGGGLPPLPEDIRDPTPVNDPTPDTRGGLSKTPTYWDGFYDGLQECPEGLGELAGVVKQAIEFMRRGDFITAARLLGMEESDTALQALWQELMSGRSTPQPGQPIPSEYERGKHGAERLCLYGLIPSAGNCVASGTVCAAKTAVRACRPVLNKLANLRRLRMPFRLPKLPAPPTPLMRGMLLEDEKFLQELAATEGKVFIVRDSNPLAMRWVGRSGFKPKPMDLKGKTLKVEELMKEGLSKAEAEKYAGLASAKGMSVAERTELLKKGYKIGSPGEQEVIRGPNGERFYSDTDLHGVYNLDGTNGWGDDLFNKLQCRFFDRGIQHGPHDNWALRNNPAKAGPNYGPQVGGGKTLTAIFPDGTKMWVQSLEQMKALYRAMGVDWRSVYPNH